MGTVSVRPRGSGSAWPAAVRARMGIAGLHDGMEPTMTATMMSAAAARDRLRRGFTLIELLVVVAVIGVLVAMLMPTLASVRNKAVMLRCKQSLGTISAAAMVYASENKGQFPSANGWVGSNSFPNCWQDIRNLTNGTMWKYLGQEPRVYQCDAFAKMVRERRKTAVTIASSYVMNQYFTWGGWKRTTGDDSDVFKGSRGQVLFPASLGLFTEQNIREFAGSTKYYNRYMEDLALGVGSYANPASDAGDILEALGSFHEPPGGDIAEGFCNVAFCDGHVDRHHPRESKEIMTPEVVKRKYFPARIPK